MTNRATRKLQAEVAASGQTPLGHMLAVLNNPDEPAARRDWAAAQAAPFIHPRLAVIDSRVVAKVEVTDGLSPDELREKARQMIRNAFAERRPLTVEGEYRVIGGREVSQDVQQQNVGQNVGSSPAMAAEPQKPSDDCGAPPHNRHQRMTTGCSGYNL